MSMCDCNQGRLKCTCKAEPINYGALDPQQRLDVARGGNMGACGLVERLRGAAAAHSDLPHLAELLNASAYALTDAQALIAELRAEAARLRQHKNDYMESAEVTRKALRAESARQRSVYIEDSKRLHDLNLLIDDLRTQLQAAPAERGTDEDWSVFIGYLIDKYEGHEIAEERLQGWVSEMLHDPHYGALFRREKVNDGQLSPIALAIQAAEEEHGGLRAAAKAIGINPGYLSRLASGEKTNPSDAVLSALGLERVVSYRARLNPAPATADSDVPGIPVEYEDDATVKEFGGIVESCHFCRAPTRYWHTGTNNPVCPECAKKHRVEELPNWLADSDVREVK